MSAVNLSDLSNADLVAIYNDNAKKPVKRFETRPIAEARVTKTLEEQGVSLHDACVSLGIGTISEPAPTTDVTDAAPTADVTSEPEVIVLTAEERADAEETQEILIACGQDDGEAGASLIDATTDDAEVEPAPSVAELERVLLISAGEHDYGSARETDARLMGAAFADNEGEHIELIDEATGEVVAMFDPPAAAAPSEGNAPPAVIDGHAEEVAANDDTPPPPPTERPAPSLDVKNCLSSGSLDPDRFLAMPLSYSRSFWLTCCDELVERGLAERIETPADATGTPARCGDPARGGTPARYRMTDAGAAMHREQMASVGIVLTEARRPYVFSVTRDTQQCPKQIAAQIAAILKQTVTVTCPATGEVIATVEPPAKATKDAAEKAPRVAKPKPESDAPRGPRAGQITHAAPEGSADGRGHANAACCRREAQKKGFAKDAIEIFEYKADDRTRFWWKPKADVAQAA